MIRAGDGRGKWALREEVGYCLLIINCVLKPANDLRFT